MSLGEEERKGKKLAGGASAGGRSLRLSLGKKACDGGLSWAPVDGIIDSPVEVLLVF